MTMMTMMTMMIKMIVITMMTMTINITMITMMTMMNKMIIKESVPKQHEPLLMIVFDGENDDDSDDNLLW